MASHRFRGLLGSLAAAAGVCFLLLGVQLSVSGNAMYAFLAWNLVLAAIPLVLALTIEAASALGGGAAVLALTLLWILFLPNAPYLITDPFFHLGRDPALPLWFDVLLFAAFAATGLAFGLVSVHRLHGLARRRLGPATVWAIIATVLAASSFGIFLGRFDQLNSWDLLRRPFGVGSDLVSHMAPLPAAEFTAGFTLFLLIAYAAFDTLVGVCCDADVGRLAKTAGELRGSPRAPR